MSWSRPVAAGDGALTADRRGHGRDVAAGRREVTARAMPAIRGTIPETAKGGLSAALLVSMIGAPHPSARARLTSGGTASSVSSASTSANAFTVLACEPSRRTATVPSSASRLPHTRITGTLARLCSRTL